ncbi:MAG TPA: hypothetical protein VGO55_00390 [Allosphingosinicella sp.]|jgi:hypothetical protein|nr:hypothetical protein [Allosphingosinicella sp.]
MSEAPHGDEGSPPRLAFSYSHALAPLLWAFACIMAVELGVTHLLVASVWSPTAAGIVSTLTFAALVWTLLLIRSLKRLPVMVGPGEVLMRLGSLKSVRVPAGRIAGVRTSWPSGAEKKRGVLNLALINYPNVMLDLDPPLAGTGPRKRPLIAVAHRLDDAAGFAAAVRRLAGRE